MNLLGCSSQDLKAWVDEMGEKPFRATQLIKWIHQKGVSSFDEMSDLSKAFREKLHEMAEVTPPRVQEHHVSSDGTLKWLFETGSGSAIETVYIPEPKRQTLCISSQVGCTLNCRFCSTGHQGFQRHLSASEIIGQLWVVQQHCLKHDLPTPSNIVMMGMGEPLLNLDAVIPALSLMLDDNAYGLSKRRVTVSTSGVVPQLDRLLKEVDVALAVSLHAPNNALRDILVPINKKYPVEVLMEACKQYVQHERKRVVTMEYVMLEKVNDEVAHAKELARLLKDVPCKINLIPFNPFPGSTFKCSSNNRMRTFQEILLKAGYITTIRKTRGQDIDAACGQLAGQVQDKTSRSRRLKENPFVFPTDVVTTSA